MHMDTVCYAPRRLGGSVKRVSPSTQDRDRVDVPGKVDSNNATTLPQYRKDFSFPVLKHSNKFQFDKKK